MGLEKLIAYHCGPALTGIKPSNLLAVRVTDKEACARAEALNKECNKRGVFFNTMRISSGTTLFLVYNKPVLTRTLKDPKTALFLVKEGYIPLRSVEAHVKKLCKKIVTANVKNRAFPHEIGVFLGYPLEDVKGFIHNKGKNCKMCGYWKVYGDEKKAGDMFRRYTECRKTCFLKASQGLPLSELCVCCR